MCSFFDPEQNLLKPFFDELHQLTQGLRQSYFINGLIKFVFNKKSTHLGMGRGKLKNLSHPSVINDVRDRSKPISSRFKMMHHA